MQANIAMKFDKYMYVDWILLYKYCLFGEKNLLQFKRYRIFPRGYFFGEPCRRLCMTEAIGCSSSLIII